MIMGPEALLVADIFSDREDTECAELVIVLGRLYSRPSGKRGFHSYTKMTSFLFSLLAEAMPETRHLRREG